MPTDKEYVEPDKEIKKFDSPGLDKKPDERDGSSPTSTEKKSEE